MRPCRPLLLSLLLLLLPLLNSLRGSAQTTAPVLLLSDIHFDPFHNPHLFPQLRDAPVARWPAILQGTPDLVEDAERTAMSLECHGRGNDTPWALLRTTLAAARAEEAHPVFITLSGDLLAHDFPCRFHHLAPDATPAELSAFSAKTVTFVVDQLRAAYPHVPVYVALGNNDSGCGDYRETADSPFLQSFAHDASQAATQGATQAAGQAHTSANHAPVDLSPEGDYSVQLPAPFQHGRLLVLEDIFESRQYTTCAATQIHAAAEQLTWLRTQLAQARLHHEPVWVMGHIPPGIDVYASFARYILHPGDICSAEPRPFLSDSALADTLLDYADVVRLALFAHTHMDEIRLLHRPAADGKPASAVPVKLVPSVTPYFGNHPAFLVAQVDPTTLVLKDWTTFVSSKSDGSTPPWTRAYRFSDAYGLPDLSAASASTLADGFTADRDGKAARSTTYREHFFAGDVGLYALGLGQVWPAYACSVRENREQEFMHCLCPGKPAAP